MATYTYSAFMITEDAQENPTGFTSVDLSLTARWPLLYAYYTTTDPDEQSLGGVSGVNFRIDGDLVDTNSFGNFDAFLTEVSWGGNSAIILGLELGGAVVFLQVDGDTLPFDDLASFQAFEALNPTFEQVTSGDYVPGTPADYDNPLLLSSFLGLSGISQNDDFVNQRTGLGQTGRFRMRDGEDTFTGSDWNEEVYGGNGNDSLYGGTGLDTLYGENDNDLLSGGAQYDLIFGGAGKDTLLGGNGNDDLNGDDGIDLLRGGNGRDALFGGTGNDLLFGDAGTDMLYGGDGNDKLDGGAGNDELHGGAGADQFIFRAGQGRDIVLDFRVADNDRLMLDKALWGGATLSAATIISTYAIDLGTATRFDFGDGELLTIIGVGTPTDLTGSITLL